jgi:hypothetical protein
VLEAIRLAGGTPLDASSCPDDNPDDYKYECADAAAMEAVLATLDVSASRLSTPLRLRGGCCACRPLLH